MSAPKLVKYQGQIYVLAGTLPKQVRYHGQVYKLAGKSTTKHKRCKKGQHWNQAAQKCMDLPKGLQKLHDAAQSASVKTLTKYPKLTQKLRERMGGHAFDNRHKAVAELHQQASEALDNHGFHELAQHHSTWAMNHQMPEAMLYDGYSGRLRHKSLKPAAPHLPSLKDTHRLYYETYGRENVLNRLNKATGKK